MTSTMLPVFQNTLKKTDQWLDEIMELLDWPDRQQAYKALRAVLHTLRDRLTIEEATDLAAQFPMLIRGLFFEGWNPTGKPNEIRKPDEFVGIVNQHFPPAEDAEYIDQEDITRAVFRVIANHVSQGEIDDVIGSMPKELRELWSQPDEF